jgi:hypothetical protein
MSNKKTTTTRSAKVTAASRKAAFTTPKASHDAVVTDGQFRILAIARQIKHIATQFDEQGDALWRLADEAAQIIEARK